MNVICHVTKFSRTIYFVAIVLVTQTYSLYCKESQFVSYEKFTDIQQYDYINEFYRAFGKQIESKFNLKWVEGGFTHSFSTNKPQFYAYRRATLEEARALVLAIILKLSEAVNADPIMLCCLKKSSSTPDFFGVDICFVYSHNWGYHDGSIDSVYSCYSKEDTSDVKKLYLQYNATDPFSDISDFKNIVYCNIEESFEDAVKLNAVSAIQDPTIHNSKKFEDELNKILASFKEEMKEKHNLLFDSVGWMVAGNSTSDISEIRTKCTYHYSANCQEARVLMLLTIEKLLATLNNSEILKPYLKNCPFSANAIKLRMLFRKNNYFVGDVPYYDGSMESAVLSDGAITYYRHISNARDSSMHDRVIYAKESYQEAQKTFENTPPLTLLKKATKGIKNSIYNSIHFLELIMILFFMLLYAITINGWSFMPPVLVFFVLRRWRRSSQED